jgi:hypothetical protein
MLSILFCIYSPGQLIFVFGFFVFNFEYFLSKLLNTYRLIFRTAMLWFFNATTFLVVYTQFIYSNRDVYISIALCSKLLHSAIAK